LAVLAPALAAHATKSAAHPQRRAAWPLEARQSEVIRVNQRSSESIRGHQRQSEVIRGNQSLLGRTHVEEARVTRREAEGSARSPFIPDEGGTQRSSAVIIGHSWSKSGGIRSESIHTRTPSRHQWSSVVHSHPYTVTSSVVISRHQWSIHTRTPSRHPNRQSCPRHPRHDRARVT
jgi:hypothetical protein